MTTISMGSIPRGDLTFQAWLEKVFAAWDQADADDGFGHGQGNGDWNGLMDVLRQHPLSEGEQVQVVEAIRSRMGEQAAEAAATWLE